MSSLASAKISSLLAKVYVSVAVVDRRAVDERADGAAEKADALSHTARMAAKAVVNFMLTVM